MARVEATLATLLGQSAPYDTPDEVERMLKKADEAEIGSYARRVPEKHSKLVADGFCVVGKRRALLARDLTFEVVFDGNDNWISKKLNSVMILVEAAMRSRTDAPGPHVESFTELAAPEHYERELAILRRIDTEPNLIESLNAAFRLGGAEAVHAILIELGDEADVCSK